MRTAETEARVKEISRVGAVEAAAILAKGEAEAKARSRPLLVLCLG